MTLLKSLKTGKSINISQCFFWTNHGWMFFLASSLHNETRPSCCCTDHLHLPGRCTRFDGALHQPNHHFPPWSQDSEKPLVIHRNTPYTPKKIRLYQIWMIDLVYPKSIHKSDISHGFPQSFPLKVWSPHLWGDPVKWTKGLRSWEVVKNITRNIIYRYNMIYKMIYHIYIYILYHIYRFASDSTSCS